MIRPFKKSLYLVVEKHVGNNFLHAFSIEEVICLMNRRTIEALEIEKERIFTEVKREVNVKFEDIKDAVKDEILDDAYYYLKMIFERMTREDYEDPNFENSVDYQLVEAMEEQFWDWFKEHYSKREIQKMNARAN